MSTVIQADAGATSRPRYCLVYVSRMPVEPVIIACEMTNGWLIMDGAIMVSLLLYWAITMAITQHRYYRLQYHQGHRQCLVNTMLGEHQARPELRDGDEWRYHTELLR